MYRPVVRRPLAPPERTEAPPAQLPCPRDRSSQIADDVVTASYAFDREHGGRLASLRLGECELLYGDASNKATSWGAYPMVPYAGRVAHGRFEFDGDAYQLEINHGPHAIHGTAFTAPWDELGPGHLVHELDSRWPLGGTVSHRAELAGDARAGRLVLELAVMATDRAMPAMVGWHPWFRRQLTPGGPSVQIEIDELESAQLYQVADDMIPTGELISPPPSGPWDHPFRRITEPIRLRWEGHLLLHLASTCDHWVIYNRPEHAVCVEPQSAPPNIFNPESFDLAPTVLQPGEQLVHTFTIDWTSLR